MQWPPLSAVVVEVVDAVADTLYLTLNRKLNMLRLPSGPSHRNQAAALKATSFFLAVTSPSKLPNNLSAARICTPP
jgi:hypothetical protein